ncbi:unnamed protein product, partial [Symbiodinium microadriaticum]
MSLDLEISIGLFHCAVQMNLASDAQMQSTAIQACGRAQQWQRALEIFADGVGGRMAFNAILDAAETLEISRSLFELALRRGVYPGLLKDGHGTLDLHELSAGAASAAVQWWLEHVAPTICATRDVSRLEIFTGVGKSRKAWRGEYASDVRQAACKVLAESGFRQVPASIPGRLALAAPLQLMEESPRPRRPAPPPRSAAAAAGAWRMPCAMCNREIRLPKPCPKCLRPCACGFAMYPAEGRPVNSVPGSSKLVTPNEPPVGPVFRPQSTPAWVKSPSPTGRKDEKNTEVEAERLWWSDACERQVKELQSAFSTEFSRLAERLTRDIAGCEQKLEQLVDNESKMRAHALAEIRREADSQGTELSELIRSHQDVKDQVTSLQASLWLRPGAEKDFDKLQKEVQETRDMVLSLQSRPVLEIPSEHSPQNLKVQQLEATLTDIRRDLVGCVDAQEQVEKLIQSLQRDCSEVQEKVRLQSLASEEQRSLHQVISQSAGDLGKGIEEVSAAMLQAESNLRQEIQKNDREIRAAAPRGLLGSRHILGTCIVAAIWVFERVLPVPATLQGDFVCRMAPMPEAAMKLLLVRPAVPAPLDPNFSPLILGKRNYLKAVAASGSKATLDWALPRADGCARYTLPVFAEDSKEVEASIYLAGVLIQEQIWQRSAQSMMLCGPAKICEALKKEFSVGGTYEFEVKSMPNVCGTPDSAFSVSIVASTAALPAAKDTPQVCGKDASGCRLAFDLGKSDIKTVAVKDNQVVYSKETEWDVTNADPDYHYKAIVDALKLAKEKLPTVQAIGGSATGTVGANNEATWCDIFPNVPPPVYKAKVVDIFQRISKELAGNVPLKVINDGEVTALAAVQKLGGKGNVMGISMGSSEGGGYANADGNLMGWINELCYVKLDLNPEAPTDPWTKGAHTGISHMYLGQRGATKLAAKAGVKVPPNYVYPHPDMCTIKHEDHAQCLKLIQKAMEDASLRPQAAESSACKMANSSPTQPLCKTVPRNEAGDWQGLVSRNDLSLHSMNHEISCCVAQSHWELGLHLLSFLPAARLRADVVSFNATMSACERGQRWDLAIGLLIQMSTAEVEADVVSYNTGIHGCGKQGQWQSALQLFCDVSRGKLAAKTITYNSVITACGRAKQWQAALQLLTELCDSAHQPDVISFNAGISGCERSGQWQAAVQLLSDMLQVTVIPDLVSFNATISACGKGGHWPWALWLLFQVLGRQRGEADVVTWSSSISACEKAGRWQQALHLLSQMSRAKVEANRVTGNACISACEKAASWQAALELMSEMLSSRMGMDVISYNAGISACGKASQWQAAV